MKRQSLALKKDQVARFVESDGDATATTIATAQHQASLRTDRSDGRLRCVGTQSRGSFARQPQQDRAIGRVPLPCQRERAVELHHDTHDGHESEACGEIGSGSHRPHRVRGRRADTDLEEFERRRDHVALMRPGVCAWQGD